MYRFTRRNMQNIYAIFEKSTGVSLHQSKCCRSLSIGKAVLLAAILGVCFGMLAFTYPRFSPLDGDQLSLIGKYQGNGIIAIDVINGSDKKLEFQNKLKLISWDTGEVEPIGDQVKFENTSFEPHSRGIMTVDLSLAYPMDEIEQTAAANAYYLLLTNQNFMFGQKWICSFLLETVPEDIQEDESQRISIEPQLLTEVEESLRFYFEDHYLDVLPAWNPANAEYLEKVHALLREQPGVFVHSVDPLLLLDTSADAQDRQIMQNHFTLDSFNRIAASMFPGEGQDCVLTLSIPIPQYEGQTDGGNGGFYIRYFFTYLTAETQQEDAYTLVYGRLLDFADMEPSKVYEDEQYTVYDMTHLFFTDLDNYIDDFVAGFGGDIYVDDQVRKRIRAVYESYGKRENLSFFYVTK